MHANHVIFCKHIFDARTFHTKSREKLLHISLPRDSSASAIASQQGQCPPEDVRKPEFAFFGQSNVGKSSMLNFLQLGRRAVAQSSLAASGCTSK